MYIGNLLKLKAGLLGYVVVQSPTQVKYALLLLKGLGKALYLLLARKYLLQLARQQAQLP